MGTHYFRDEIDAIAQSVTRLLERLKRVVAFLSLMVLKQEGSNSNGYNRRVNSIDEALRRPGIDREIEIGIPDKRSENKSYQFIQRNAT